MMKHMMAASLLFAFVGSGVAMADDDCSVPMDQWQPREAVEKMADALGWKVSRIRIDDGCYQIRGVDETGQVFKAKIDPATLAIVKMKRKGADDGDHKRERRHPAGSGMADPSGLRPSNRLHGTGEPPKSIVK